MSNPAMSNLVTWSIVGLATAGVIGRPLKVPEAVWAIGGACSLVALGLLPWSAALSGMGKGCDVYLFLIGMMLLAELARREGLFDWLAARAVALAGGSATRLFGLVYLVGIVVTVFLSNDATAVVLTPAVAAAARTAKVEHPLPYLFICAFIANAASFVLPISNPANLVIYADRMPPLLQWVPSFALPSLLSIGVTYALLRWTQRDVLRQPVATQPVVPSLSYAAKCTAWGIVATAVTLLVASACGVRLGLPTCVAGVVTLGTVAATARSSPWKWLREISWSVIPLVAGLFVLVEALDRSGMIRWLSAFLRDQAQHSALRAAAGSGIVIGIATNLVNNLPAGLIAGTAAQTVQLPPVVVRLLLIGVDLGPNLSVTGSLATILWLAALRREGIEVKPWDFLKVGLWVMPPALLLALAASLGAGG